MAFDAGDEGIAKCWFEPSATAAFGQTIIVPFAPESPASGVGDSGDHPIVWYRREVSPRTLAGPAGNRLILRFGAVDYAAQVWLAGIFLGSHEGGSAPFDFDVTEQLTGTGDPVTLVVRAADDPRDVAQARGKQDWRNEPHGIWYERTTGIWQSVWLESVPPLHVRALSWQPDAVSGAVNVSVQLSERPASPVSVQVELSLASRRLARLTFEQDEPFATATIAIPAYANGQEQISLLWSPEHPHLIDAVVVMTAENGPADRVESYFGLRSVGWANQHFLLNDRPYYLRAVLEQGYWPDSHLTAPSWEALRDEVLLIKDLGFNAARIHQKVEDPQFLYWADRLGLLVWAENPSAYEFSAVAVRRMVRDWVDIVLRDRSHPCIMTWVPLNESWGVQQIAHDPRQLHYAQALYHLTKALDPTRPVVSNDGWEHAASDLWTIHDYSTTREELEATYADAPVVERLLSGIGPLGRRMRLTAYEDTGQPIIVSEFGGISYVTHPTGESWGYATVHTAEEFEAHLEDLFAGVQSSPVLAGFCYTQLTDTAQEANGLVNADRSAKLPPERIRSIVLGERVDTSSHARPKHPVEQPNLPRTQS